MKFIHRILKRQAAATLVRQALCAERKVNRKAIMECIDLLAGAHGENWSRVSREAAAGMALVMLAKQATLGAYVNDSGWELVPTFIDDHPEIARYVSPRAMRDIDVRQATRLDRLPAEAA